MFYSVLTTPLNHKRKEKIIVQKYVNMQLLIMPIMNWYVTTELKHPTMIDVPIFNEFM